MSVRRLVVPWLCLVLGGLLPGGPPARAETGAELFGARCAACHSLGEGRRLGPDLAGVTERRDEAWLRRFIRSPQGLAQSGDASAKALLAEYAPVLMPDQALDDAQLRAVLAHLRGGAAPPRPPAPQTEPEPANDARLVVRGLDLFEGRRRLAHGGPPCNACHHVRNDAVIGGGVLARDLTAVFSRVGGEGVHAILKSSPFPVMQAAYQERPLAAAEAEALIAFLKEADARQAFQQPGDYGWRLFGAGLGGALGLLGLIAFAGRRRKRGTVNRDVYERQKGTE
ncbi:MAG: cytochrome c [Gammaproteobacteria bacterium]|nr:cytochrome c [Gammaproteobacteria bacterium]